jgi:hypothetical protein
MFVASAHAKTNRTFLAIHHQQTSRDECEKEQGNNNNKTIIQE